MATQDEQRIIDQYPYKTPSEILQEVFEYESPWNVKGWATVSLKYVDMRGDYVGSFCAIRQDGIKNLPHQVMITDTRPRKIIVRLHGEYSPTQLNKALR